MPGAVFAGSGIGKGVTSMHAPGAIAGQSEIGTVTSVNADEMTFVCQWQTASWTYHVTSSTVFQMNGNAASFADLKAGMNVQVQYTVTNGFEMANVVTITP
jgi:hypothetical protein